jgi:ribosomal protein S18 acetylase RimI-like enzyme
MVAMVKYRLRPALRRDCRDIARLFQMSSEGVADYIWSTLAREGESLIDVGCARYAREGVDFSYRNCCVADQAGQVIGMLHSFEMKVDPDAEEETDPVLRPYSELEIPGTLYISSVAVYPQHRGHGVGSELMKAAEIRAREMGLGGLSLIVYGGNVGAHTLYERIGYVEADRRPVVPHPMIHVAGGDAILMVKRIAAG